MPEPARILRCGPHEALQEFHLSADEVQPAFSEGWSRTRLPESRRDEKSMHRAQVQSSSLPSDIEDVDPARHSNELVFSRHAGQIDDRSQPRFAGYGEWLQANGQCARPARQIVYWAKRF